MSGGNHDLGKDGTCLRHWMVRRRVFLAGAATAISGITAYPVFRLMSAGGSPVFIARNQRYDGLLSQTIADGLVATGIVPNELSGRTVLLKPNLVEPIRTVPHMTTHAAVVLAAADVFRGWGARVLVGEAPGHVRDTEMALLESGLGEALVAAQLDFSDLNYEETLFVKNSGRTSGLRGFRIPRVVAEADLIVSMPKLKTHHWIGMTAAMKNMYGILPGVEYGWPKNVLHHAGIPQTVFDLNASLPPIVAIVDGITCMEGDGPIMGTAKSMGLIIIGTNAAAVDATCSRIIGIDPYQIEYLKLADGRLGPTADRFIVQRGESWASVARRFSIPEYSRF